MRGCDRLRARVLSVATITAVWLAGCGECGDCGSVTGNGSASETTAAEVVLIDVVNMYCVVSPEDMVSPNRRTIPELTREHDGVTYGLCCDGCLTVWDGWTAEERRAGIARAMAREPQP